LGQIIEISARGLRSPWFILVILVGVAAVLRFYGLEFQSLWNDELSTWQRSNYPGIDQVINLGVRPDVHPPGYQILMFFNAKLLGDSAFALRFPSALSGTLSVLFIFALGRRLFGKREGLIAAGLLAVLWAPIYYSQETRAYSILMFLTIATAYFWYGWVSQLRQGLRPSYIDLLGYVITACCLTYCHYFGSFLLALQLLAVFVLFIRRPRYWGWILALYLAIGLLYVPWIPETFRDMGQDSWIRHPGSVYKTFSKLTNFYFRGSAGLRIPAMIALGYGVMVVLWDQIGHWRNPVASQPAAANKQGQRLSQWLVLGWLLLPVTITYTQSVLSTPVFTTRNLIVTLPAAILLVARALERLPIVPVMRTAVALVLILWALTDLAFIQDYYSTPTKQQFREATQYLAANAGTGEDTLLLGYAHSPDYFNYYLERTTFPNRIEFILGKKNERDDLDQLLEEHHPQHLWYIRAHRKPHKAFVSKLRRDMRQVDYHRFRTAEVWHFAAREDSID